MLSLAETIIRAAQTNGDAIATRCNSRSHTWTQFVTRVSRVAGGLIEKGLQPGCRAAILALNSDRYYEFMFAVPWAGGVFVPINTRLALPEIIYWLRDSESQMLFVGDEFLPLLPELKAQLPLLQHYIYIGEAELPQGLLSYADWAESSDPVTAAPRGGDDLAGLYYTGGTTGRSKGVMLSHNNLLSNALQSLPIVQYQDTDVYLHVAPMFHIADSFNSMLLATMAGENCFLPAFDPEATMKSIQQFKVNRILLVPTMVNLLIHHPALPDYDLSSLETLVYGASPMPEALLRRSMEMLPQTKFIQAYGQTEAAPVLTLLEPKYHTFTGANSGKIRSAGRAVLGVKLAVLDEQDRELPRGTVGQICGRGDNVMLGYHGMPEVTHSTLENDWLHTGDMGYMDEDGFLFIVDRLKDMIISGGENVYSVEVENAIYQHPSVIECAVLGIPHSKWGEQVHAIVRLKEGKDLREQDIIEHCKQIIAAFKCPRSVFFTQQPFPLSGAGKILKKDLREPYWKENNE